jgi:photosynthetic reaction center cytochrome c subunit
MKATILGIAAGLVVLAPYAVFAQAAETKTAEQVYKNIQELKGTPADQVGPAMQFMAASLGVQCTFCHVQGQMDADDKGAKKTARAMIAMTAAINKNSFHGQLQVSCYSCHRGSARPVAVPPVQDSDTAAAPPAPRPMGPGGAQGPTADEILEKYVTALGGSDAIHKTTSRSMTGKILAAGNESPIEVLTKAPNKRVTISKMGNGESFTAFDGTAGWMASTGRPVHDMSASESASAGLDAEFYLALRIKELFPQVRRGRPEQVNGVECNVLTGSGGGRPLTRFYFDSQSGLLVRMVRYSDTPVGRMPVQIDYADYKDVDGVKIPLRWTLSRPGGRFTIQIADVKVNTPIDDAKFAKPAGQ